MGFRLENELEKAAIPFLEGNRFQYSWQVPLHNRVIDLAAINVEGQLIGIEFKLKDWKRALKQALRNSNAFDYIYICVPGGSYLDRLTKEAKELGIGVMIYVKEIGSIRIELPAQRVMRQWKPNVEYIKNFLRSRGKS